MPRLLAPQLLRALSRISISGMRLMIMHEACSVAGS
jgi:hypothetical protein